ncbi:hypothetical protein AT3G47100 [Arabidopsis thaliana]|jgi:hypothetical protein|uniref:Uncharacterized protein n=2 Tax=Arabidopsis thaliana TaxID=3702 RepID=F4JAC4_ARATH|nr:uncharacterized protein AT3G47100 [Arabidopsis thaliana]AEE78243.1 hypothetical protein AT3G47100 [Arabidopsis thaliana]CAA0384753.1 unnamed protein product [Arabidopsis thaliana]|eukprot:NP_190294.2 hypothetical protein AT3G47100 [Arabidopsis thaliana]
MASFEIAVRFPRDAGKFPVRLFTRRDKRTSRGSEPSLEGTSCSRLLEDRSLVKREKQLDIYAKWNPTSKNDLAQVQVLKPEQLPYLKRDTTIGRVVRETKRCEEIEVTDRGRDNTG